MHWNSSKWFLRHHFNCHWIFSFSLENAGKHFDRRWVLTEEGWPQGSGTGCSSITRRQTHDHTTDTQQVITLPVPFLTTLSLHMDTYIHRHKCRHIHRCPWASQVAPVVKNPPAKVGRCKGPRSIPESGRSPEGGHGNPLQYSCLRFPWIEEPGGLQSLGSQSQTQLKWLSIHTQMHTHTHIGVCVY